MPLAVIELDLQREPITGLPGDERTRHRLRALVYLDTTRPFLWATKGC